MHSWVTYCWTNFNFLPKHRKEDIGNNPRFAKKKIDNVNEIIYKDAKQWNTEHFSNRVMWEFFRLNVL